MLAVLRGKFRRAALDARVTSGEMLRHGVRVPRPALCAFACVLASASMFIVQVSAASADSSPDSGVSSTQAASAGTLAGLRGTLASWLGRQLGPTANATPTQPLSLIRSFEIPTDDPDYSALANTAFTYDQAVAAVALTTVGDSAEPTTVLDQLARLQNPDGSIGISFDVSTGQANTLVRSGTLAWVALAGSVYDRTLHTYRYLEMQRRAADYLLTLQGPSGLIRGGPDVQWSSAEHNLEIAAELRRLAVELLSEGAFTEAAHYGAAARTISQAIDANLLVQSGGQAHFMQGLGDPTLALDAQTLGALYLQSRGQYSLALSVLQFAQQNFAVGGLGVALSSDPATYNMTWQAPGPFSGMAPYAGAGAPQILWAEGTADVVFAGAALGVPSSALESDLAQFAEVSASAGSAPLTANQTIRDDAWGVDYHVWPAAAAAAWTILAGERPSPPLFY